MIRENIFNIFMRICVAFNVHGSFLTESRKSTNNYFSNRWFMGLSYTKEKQWYHQWRVDICYFARHSYVFFSIVFFFSIIRMSLVCHSYLIVCHSFATQISSLCHSYVNRIYLFVILCYSHVTREFPKILSL